MKIIFLFVLLFRLCFATEFASSPKAEIAVELYYTANSDQDGDFIVSQLVAQKNDASNTLNVYTFAYGGVQVLNIPGPDLENKYYCTGPDSLCETNLIHRCVQNNQKPIEVQFLVCYFQNELFPFNLLGASEQCLTKLAGVDGWNQVNACSKTDATLKEYGETYFAIEKLKPNVMKTPYLLLNDKHLALAAVDLRKALCRVQATDMWQCESVDRYKEPKLEIYYTPYDQESTNFFLKQFTLAVAQNVFDTTQRVDTIPNPDKVLTCQGTSCWTYHAHWCIFEFFASVKQLEILQCAFAKSASDQERIKQCVSDQEYLEITNCVNDIEDYKTPIEALQLRLDLLIPQAQQESVEILIRDQPNVQAKSSVLSELCTNYFEIDDQTLGCKVNRPKVQIFYETQSPDVASKFNELVYLAQYSPYETLADFEFIPYGKTEYKDGGYVCAHGEHQCQANFVHACLYQQRYTAPEDKALFLQFFLCSTSYTEGKNPTDLAEECVDQTYLDDGPNLWIALIMCSRDKENTLWEELRKKTEAISLTQVPEFVVDGVKKTAEIGDAILSNLCKGIEPIKPKICSAIQTDSSQRLQVQIYLTADETSRDFVKSEIKPLLAAPKDTNLRLRDVIDWQFVPWGPAQYNATTGEVTCPNGPEECLANRVLACAATQRQNGQLGTRADKLRLVSFIACYFDSIYWQTHPLDAAQECTPALSTLDNYPQVWQCAVQDLKQGLELKMKDITENNYPVISKFPEVVINQQRVNSEALVELNKYLCAKYKASPLPSECKSTDGGPSSAFSVQLSISAVVAIFIFRAFFF